MFLRSLESKFHDLYKTHLTFILNPLLKVLKSFKVKKLVFGLTTQIMAPKTLRRISDTKPPLRLSTFLLLEVLLIVHFNKIK